jgi:hypothetical protein
MTIWYALFYGLAPPISSANFVSIVRSLVISVDGGPDPHASGVDCEAGCFCHRQPFWASGFGPIADRDLKLAFPPSTAPFHWSAAG